MEPLVSVMFDMEKDVLKSWDELVGGKREIRRLERPGSPGESVFQRMKGDRLFQTKDRARGQDGRKAGRQEIVGQGSGVM